MRRRWALVAMGIPLAAVASCVGARSLQGPIRGRVELSDAAPRDDLVAKLHCRGGNIHGTHRADERLRTFQTQERFLFPWAWRGLAPAGCYVEVLHPLYRMQHAQLERRFSFDLGTLRLQHWDALLAAPEGLSIADVHRHLFYLRYYYLAAFPREAARARLARYVPGLHALFERGLNTLPAMDVDRFGSDDDSLENLRAIEESVGYARPPEQEALFEAAARGDAARVRALLGEGADPDAWNAQHAAAIHLAAAGGHADVVLALLDGGAAVDRQKEGLGDTALLVALQAHDARTALALLERGADPTLACRGAAPLHVASRGGMLEVVRALVERGALSGAREAYHRDGSLAAAAGEGHSEVVRALIAAGVPPDGGLPAWTALMHAAAHGHLRAAEVLLDAGANPNAVSERGKTPLGLARENERREMIALLESHGAAD